RSLRDWSSDVCSSDLRVVATARLLGQATGAALVALSYSIADSHGPTLALALGAGFAGAAAVASGLRLVTPQSADSAAMQTARKRSEERRVGKADKCCC